MAEALKAKSLPRAALAFDARAQRRAARLAALRGKTFEALTPHERDLLLKHVAVHLGLILDSDDA